MRLLEAKLEYKGTNQVIIHDNKVMNFPVVQLMDTFFKYWFPSYVNHVSSSFAVIYQ